MEFKTPYFIILGIAALILWTVDYLYLFKKPELFLPNLKYKKSIPMLKYILLSIGVIGWLSLSYSLMGPREPLKFEKNKIEVNDIMFVVDTSDSMRAIDFKPNRLEEAKKQIERFVGRRPKDRIGVIAFGEKALTVLPFTVDFDLIKNVVGQLTTGFLGPGTNIGDALGLAAARAAGSIAKNKVIILLTDGVSNIGNMTPIQAAHAAKEQKTKVYTIGIGSEKGAKLPVQGFFGTQYQRIPGGSIDMKTLKEISSITGGKTFRAGDAQGLKNIFDEIQKLEKTEIESSSRIVYKEHYYKYLLFGLILIFLADFFRKFQLREVL